MAKLVKYHSDINKIPLRNFSEKEINIFFSLLFKAKEEGTNKIKIKFTELRNISNGDTHSNRFLKSLENLNFKLLNLSQKITLPDGKIVMFNLFNEFVIDPVNNELEVQVHERFYYMLNDFLTYTQFELEQFVSLKSSYSKNIFRLLKQFESTNFLSIYVEEFKRVLCVPESYKMGEVDRRVIKPAILELSPFFPDLKLEKIKDGRKIKSLKFSWENYCSLKNLESKFITEIKISEQLNKIIEKAKKNRFIKPLLTVSNIEKLVKKYSEDLLINGLKFAIQEINYEVKAFSYLEKTIETGIENNKKKIVIVTQQTEVKKEIKNVLVTQEKINKKGDDKEEILDKELEEFKGELDRLAKEKLSKMRYMFLKPSLKTTKTWEQIQMLIEEYDLK
ncbi:replication initiation protein (plasmid) [Fusobacteria bacterium ZRK30]|nr:replication initiation protein [Fusobacteria bacterium ZRK30]